MKTIKISVKSLKQLFHPCTPDFIANVCHARCCDHATKGAMVTIHPTEEWAIEMVGGKVKGGFLDTGGKKCGFKDGDTCLCSLHTSDHKPFGCIASPFTLNKGDTLIVRNRYRMLKCYRTTEGKVPVYEAHRASLDLLFGHDQAGDIINEIKRGAETVTALMGEKAYAMLKDNDAVKKNFK